MKAASNRTSGKSERVKKALESLQQSAPLVYSLDDIGRRFERCPFSPISMTNVIESLVAAIRDQVWEAEASIEEQGMEVAQGECARTCDALNAIESFVCVMSSDDRMLVPKPVAGTTILALTVQAGKCIARAELALGAKDTSTMYLDDDISDPNRAATEEGAHHG